MQTFCVRNDLSIVCFVFLNGPSREKKMTRMRTREAIYKCETFFKLHEKGYAPTPTNIMRPFVWLEAIVGSHMH